MPVKGLTDRRRLPRIGKIRLGYRDEKGVPHALDHFCVREDNSTSRSAAEAFLEVYKTEPRELDIMLPTDDVEDWCDPYYRMFSQSWKAVCRGDGEVAEAKWDPNQDGPRPEGVDSGTWANKHTQAWVPRAIPCLAERCPMQEGDRPQCRLSLNFFFLLPKVRGIGAWQLDTRSIHGVRALLDSVALIRSVTGGRIRGLPLTLRLVPREVAPPNVKKKTVYVVELSLPGFTLEDLLRAAQSLPEKALLAPPRIDEDELAEAYGEGEGEDGQGGGPEPQGSVEAGPADPSVSLGLASAPDDACIVCGDPVAIYDADGKPYCEKHAPIEGEAVEVPAESVGAESSSARRSEAADPEPRQAMLMPDKKPPKTLGELLTRANREFGYLSGEVWKVLGQQLQPTAPLVDLARAWELLRQNAVGNKPPVAAGGR
jgi:hypothetical protein